MCEFVAQGKITFAAPSTKIESTGASTCSIVAIIDKNVGTLMGHIDYLVPVSKIQNCFSAYSEKFKTYEDSIAVVTSNFGQNISTMQKVIKVLEKFIPASKVITIPTTRLSVHNGDYESKFTLSIWHNKVKMNNELFERENCVRNYAKVILERQKHLKEKTKNDRSRDEYGRKPYPRDGVTYGSYSYDKDEWILCDPSTMCLRQFNF